MLGRLQAQLARAPAFAVEPDARDAVALDLALDPQEDLGVDRLRTGIAAEQPSGDRGEQEQRQRRDHQQYRQVDHVLRPQHQAEQIELARAEVEQHRLAAVPLQPRRAVEHQLRGQHHGDAPVGEGPAHGARIDLAPDLVQRGLGRVDAWRVHGCSGRVGMRDRLPQAVSIIAPRPASCRCRPTVPTRMRSACECARASGCPRARASGCRVPAGSP